MNEEKLAHPVFIIMGASGSGKTKLTEAVFSREQKIVSYTTRKRRIGEVQDVDYYFVSLKEFERLIVGAELIEYDNYAGAYYGIGKMEIFKRAGKQPAYNVLTFNGFTALEKHFGEKVIPVFLEVSRENIEQRLHNRRESQQVITARLAIYEQDMKIKTRLKDYPQAIILDGNQKFPQVVAELRNQISRYKND